MSSRPSILVFLALFFLLWPLTFSFFGYSPCSLKIFFHAEDRGMLLPKAGTFPPYFTFTFYFSFMFISFLFNLYISYRWYSFFWPEQSFASYSPIFPAFCLLNFLIMFPLNYIIIIVQCKC